MYEHRTERMLSRAQFIGRLVGHAGGALLLIAGSLGLGVAGFVQTEGMDPLTAFLQAAMLAGGMGPIAVPVTVAGKWFAAFYALYCGLLLVVAAGIVAAPVLHRILHTLHLEEDD